MILTNWKCESPPPAYDFVQSERTLHKLSDSFLLEVPKLLLSIYLFIHLSVSLPY